MIWNCQRKVLTQFAYHVHQVEAKDEATARAIMFNRSGGMEAWLNLEKTLVWSAEDWTAL
jgi:hypothetical protein